MLVSHRINFKEGDSNCVLDAFCAELLGKIIVTYSFIVLLLDNYGNYS
ncbi:hypothetical protein MTR67_019497 [Solanum verrucosum]|uniref:Uncharacterized protein n=1 Tax=Solanum verrucosum TaxID=315347 RepID=A0AAF0QLM2_SOLVR|nr:hypothetical protein MTR67_019497 [Solanum verrucosum]